MSKAILTSEISAHWPLGQNHQAGDHWALNTTIFNNVCFFRRVPQASDLSSRIWWRLYGKRNAQITHNCMWTFQYSIKRWNVLSDMDTHTLIDSIYIKISYQKISHEFWQRQGHDICQIPSVRLKAVTFILPPSTVMKYFRARTTCSLRYLCIRSREKMAPDQEICNKTRPYAYFMGYDIYFDVLSE